MEDKMTRFYYCREQVSQQIIQNLIEAGEMSEDKAQEKLAELGTLDSKDLMTVLLESHNLREQRFKEHGSLYRYFFVDVRSMGHN